MECPSQFFPDEAIFRELRGDCLAHHALNGEVSLADHVAWPLAGDYESSIVEGQARGIAGPSHVGFGDR